jgi:hypothetical protein
MGRMGVEKGGPTMPVKDVKRVNGHCGCGVTGGKVPRALGETSSRGGRGSRSGRDTTVATVADGIANPGNHYRCLQDVGFLQIGATREVRGGSTTLAAD